MSKKAVIDTAVVAFTAATLVVVTTQGDELGKAQQSLITDIQTTLSQSR